MTPEEIDAISFKLGLISGIFYYLTYAISSYFLRKRALQKIKNELEEDEYIVSEPQNDFVIDIIIPFVVGGFTGMFILPFFIYPEIRQINGYMGGISRDYLSLCIVAIFIGVFFNAWVACMQFVLTNKRMFYALTFKYLYKFMKIFNKFQSLCYSDIKDFKYDTYLTAKFLDIYTNDNRQFRIAGFKNLDEIKSIIEKYIDCHVEADASPRNDSAAV